jgi:hypothetical protein
MGFVCNSTGRLAHFNLFLLSRPTVYQYMSLVPPYVATPYLAAASTPTPPFELAYQQLGFAPPTVVQVFSALLLHVSTPHFLFFSSRLEKTIKLGRHNLLDSQHLCAETISSALLIMPPLISITK